MRDDVGEDAREAAAGKVGGRLSVDVVVRVRVVGVHGLGEILESSELVEKKKRSKTMLWALHAIYVLQK